MQQIQEIIIGGSMSILTILAGIAVKAVKDFLVAKGGEKAIKITEILAKNAVNATEQVAQKLDIHGEQKLAHAKDIVKKGLEQYNIYLTNSQIDNFIEAAVKQANEAWKAN
ncbi:phage holin [Streptococcus sp. SS6]|uniref:phage holin n=1 Tax=Streptococcus sp. SS6 TaxID=3018254 RepID=UPI00263D9C3C|nr:phage holin [Streptococcus sp. SS6]MDN5036052.1 phage holin [Streptococcus sp. SS6]